MLSAAENNMNVFMGAYVEVLEVADALLGVDLVIVEDKPASQQAREYCTNRSKRMEVLGPEDSPHDLLDGVEMGLALVASFAHILCNEFIRRAGLILNFHPGVIEMCRGRHPLPCAILARHALMGVTCHVIDSEAVDAGPIVAQVRLPINYAKDYRYNDR
ncbi:MAG: hypothetical protein KAV82_16865, partial [Phycisphaerae bacterium]|nr:hypothetical protein [Phycisphaerae bacterium]